MNRNWTVFFVTLLWIPKQGHAKTNSNGPSRTECARIAALIETKVLEPNRGLHKDSERGSADPYWNRLSQALLATDAKNLEAMFTPPEGITLREYYDSLFWGIKSGEIKGDAQLDRLIVELRDFVNEYGSQFENQKNDRAYHILEAVKAADKAHSFDGDPTMAAKRTIKALETGEEALFARAMAESVGGKKFDNNKWYDSFYRFFSPHFYRMKNILDYTNSMRARIQNDQIADDAIYDVIAKYQDRFSAEELSTMRSLIADTPGKLADARKRAQTFYGRELSLTDPAHESDYRLQDIQKRIPKGKNTHNAKLEKSIQESRRDLDKLDEAVAEARKRAGEGPRPWEEYRDPHLQIRHLQYKEETAALASQYENVLERHPSNPEYDVSASRTVTETWTTQREEPYTDSEGNRKTRKVPVHHSDSWTQRIDAVLEARYEEVLDGEMSPRDSEVANQFPSAWSRHGGSLSYGSASVDRVHPERASAILEKGTKAREFEAPFRKQIGSAVDEIEEIRSDYKKLISTPEKHQALLAQFDKLRAQLEAARKEHLEAYQKWDSKKVNKQWSDDKPEDFKDRNELLHERFRHMITLIDHFREQARRKQDSLELQYDFPNYDAQLAQLEKIHNRNRLIQFGGGALTALGVGLYIYNSQQQNDDDRSSYEKKVDLYRRFEDSVDSK